MVSVLEFVAQLLASVVELVRIFVFEVLLGVDPITTLSFLVGAALTTATVAYFTYLVAGALVNLLTGLGASAPDAPTDRPAR